MPIVIKSIAFGVNVPSIMISNVYEPAERLPNGEESLCPNTSAVINDQFPMSTKYEFEIPLAPGAPGAPAVPGIPGVPAVPGIPGVPAVPG